MAERRGLDDMNSGREISPELLHTPVRQLSKRRMPRKPSQIVDTRCKTCTHPQRAFLETQIVLGTSYYYLSEHITPKVSAQSMKNHFNKHMDLQDSVMRSVIERNADLAGINESEAVGSILTARGALDVLMQKGHEGIVNGSTKVEARDLIQSVRIIAEMEKNTEQVAVDELQNQVNIFMEAIRQVCAPEIQAQIGAKVTELREDPMFSGYRGSVTVIQDAVVVEDTAMLDSGDE